MTFRRRILVAMLPLFALLFVLGATGTILITQLGMKIDRILRENYDSVVYMRNLNEALERIDSSFQFAMAGREDQALKQFKENRPEFEANVLKESHNITEPGERDMSNRLTELACDYGRRADAFYAAAPQRRQVLYFGAEEDKGLYGSFTTIKSLAATILRINEAGMEAADQEARRTARASRLWYGVGLACGIALAVVLVGNMIRTIVRPVRAVTESAAAIGAGNLDQVVPITSDDELGRLAATFNTMARQLREFRQSHKAQLIRAQQTSQATIDSFPEPVLVLDSEQRVEMANPAARRLFGLPRRESNAPPSVWQPPDPLRQPLTEALQTQREYVPEGFDKVVHLNVRDESRSFLPRVLPIAAPSGDTLGAAVLLEDVTRFRLLDEIKSNMVSTVSHELKTPLTSIRLVLHLLLEENVGPLAPKQVELLVDARDNAERLLTMINNLLDLARLEQGSPLHREPTLPGALIHEAVEAFLPQAKDRGIHLVLRDPGGLSPVAVDHSRFQHALRNLLDNALAHTPTGGQVTVAAEAFEGNMVFTVADTGAGIPAEYLPLVFEKYFRVPGDTTPGGSGLGLAIVREIVAAHGGTVDCQSCPGTQTVFRIKIPVAG